MLKRERERERERERQVELVADSICDLSDEKKRGQRKKPLARSNVTSGSGFYRPRQPNRHTRG